MLSVDAKLPGTATKPVNKCDVMAVSPTKELKTLILPPTCAVPSHTWLLDVVMYSLRHFGNGVQSLSVSDCGAEEYIGRMFPNLTTLYYFAESIITHREPAEKLSETIRNKLCKLRSLCVTGGTCHAIQNNLTSSITHLELRNPYSYILMGGISSTFASSVRQLVITCDNGRYPLKNVFSALPNITALSVYGHPEIKANDWQCVPHLKYLHLGNTTSIEFPNRESSPNWEVISGWCVTNDYMYFLYGITTTNRHAYMLCPHKLELSCPYYYSLSCETILLLTRRLELWSENRLRVLVFHVAPRDSLCLYEAIRLFDSIPSLECLQWIRTTDDQKYIPEDQRQYLTKRRIRIAHRSDYNCLANIFSPQKGCHW